MPIPQLTRAAEVRGVTGWVHPILSFPWNPVVLVEGPIDVDVLYHVSSLTGSEQLRFLALPGLDPSEKQSGKDSIVSYLRKNQGLVQNRPPEAPLLVLFDWDVSNQELQKANVAYGAGADRCVLKMNEQHCAQALGADFRGIERFYPPDVILDAHEAGELVLGIAPNKPYSISKAQLRQAKNFLRDRLVKTDSLKMLEPLVKVIEDLENAARTHSVVQLSLPGITKKDVT